ncbi:Non-functional NADPH-dependent codeinone reductase [Actinidia chinensis var. chinensis]|uniref:Non-functional NADPH-dependent codeinone reductase n=1 Tax=Actinidia chinensis var. chinensis TaxID=1590841 RepID=A0A2R6QR25_ACTCC|nr:Non-functional NADPH-dependent codeinone reductase [Actinidia chinensis var. chinensis]
MDTNPCKIPELTLTSGGLKMPVLGFGTASDPPVQPETAKRAVLEAIGLGYRHFDTAALYFTEEPLGEAIAEALGLGLIGSREELFITSKLWCSDAHDKLVLSALQRTLKNLKLEYLDLYLIHWPVGSKAGIYEYPIKKEDFVPMDYKSVWAAMEECQRLGLTKAIGVSNFSCQKLSQVLSTATIPPSVNQVEVNPVWQQKKLIEFCKGNGILVISYAALGAFGTFYGTNRVMESEVLKEIAKARGKTVPQVCLRWAYEQGIGVLVKSFNKERMKQNLGIFNWELTKEEREKIGEIPQSRACLGHDYTSVHGPFKTIEELWDGEL